MSTNEVIVAVLGLLLGYWIVSLFLKPKAPPGSYRPRERATSEAGDNAANAITARTPPAAPPWHEVLGVSPAAAPDEIRSAYRSLIGQYHPDKVASLGLELRVLAERKSKEIGAAYREGMRMHGLVA